MFPNQRFGEVCWHNMHVFLYIHSPYFMCHCTEYKLLVLQVTISEENTPNATIQQFVTAKISGCVWKQGNKTHSSIRQSNLQLQNDAALMSCRIRAVEHRKSAGGLVGVHPGLKNRILLNYTRIENAHEVRKKIFDFLLFIEIQQTFSFSFSPLRHNKCLNASMLTTGVFEFVQQFYHATEIGRPNAANTVRACADQP